MKTLITILCATLLFGCVTNPNGKVTVSAAKFGQDASAFANSPAGQALVSALVGASINAVKNVGAQYATTGKVGPRQIVSAALDGSASQLWSLRSGNQTAVITAVTQGAGVGTVSNVSAPIIASS